MRSRWFWLVGSFILFLSFLFLILPYQSALVFYQGNTNNMVAYLPMKSESRFQITFTHSIHLTDVVEKYSVTENLEIRQDEIQYEQFGIGMPSNAVEGETFVYEDGKYSIKNLNNVFSSMNIRNGKTVSEHRLSWIEDGEERQVWFNDYFEPGDWFRVRLDNISCWDRLKGVKIGG
jgi:hypothetical protein